MINPWMVLPSHEVQLFQITTAFLESRLAEHATIDWALRLDRRARAKRLAVLNLLSRRPAAMQTEPWRSAWRLIEEGWATETDDETDSMRMLDIEERLSTGERSGALIEAIVTLLRPRIVCEPLHAEKTGLRRRRRAPKTVWDLLSLQLTSSEMPDLDRLNLSQIHEVEFLNELGERLNAALRQGLLMAARLSGEHIRAPRMLGGVRRVYFVSQSSDTGDQGDPDAYMRGLAPVVKLLHGAIRQLGTVDARTAQATMRLWEQDGQEIFVRLWQALARDSDLVADEEVCRSILCARDEVFWDDHRHPEFAELRAHRFDALTAADQAQVIGRIERGPPRKLWPRSAEPARVRDAQRHMSARELQRIHVVQGSLPVQGELALQALTVGFPNLRGALATEADFMEGRSFRHMRAEPDNRFSVLQGPPLLRELEDSLAQRSTRWDDDGSAAAAEWMRLPANVGTVVEALRRPYVAPGGFPNVLDRAIWVLSDSVASTQAADNMPGATADEVLDLISSLDEKAKRAAIDSLSQWFQRSARFLGAQDRFRHVWLSLWPIAASVANEANDGVDEPHLNVLVQTPSAEEPRDLDTLNTAAGKLIGAFLELCPEVDLGGQPFNEPLLRKMRDAAMQASGRAQLIVHHRLIEQLSYFLRADPSWTQAELVQPLRDGDDRSVVLWRAVARRLRHTDVLSELGEQFVARVHDARLGRESRQSLAFSVIVEMLFSLKEQRRSAVALPSVQQMLRSMEDELRGSAADTVRRFVREVGASLGGQSSVEDVFSQAGQPFLSDVWPQERTLSTPGVARAFARLPSACGNAFVEAAHCVTRFLVPFDVWSMADYGLLDSEGNRPKLGRIDTSAKAAALLELMDGSIGVSDKSVIPHDLGAALEHIAKVAPSLVQQHAYRRLSALARR